MPSSVFRSDTLTKKQSVKPGYNVERCGGLTGGKVHRLKMSGKPDLIQKTLCRSCQQRRKPPVRRDDFVQPVGRQLRHLPNHSGALLPSVSTLQPLSEPDGSWLPIPKHRRYRFATPSHVLPEELWSFTSLCSSLSSTLDMEQTQRVIC